jgi:Fibronectin-attachment protein (FAP)
MQHPDAMPRHRRSPWKSLAAAAVTGATVVTFALPGGTANADPLPPPPPPAPAPAFPPPPPPADPNAPPPDPNAPPGDPNAPLPPPPEPGRVNNAAGGFSYVVPAGWKVSDASQLSYGQALLTKIPTEPNEQAPTDTSVLLGRLDLKLFAGAETDNSKAANRLASDMGEFFMPYAGTRINQAVAPLDAAGMPGAAAYYEVKFTDTTKPNGQIWAGVVGSTPPPGLPTPGAAPGSRIPQRWFVVWLGSATHPVDAPAAIALAQSIRPFAPPPPPEPPPPDPNAPPPDPNAPPPPGARPAVGVPVPVTNAPPEMMPPG